MSSITYHPQHAAPASARSILAALISGSSLAVLAALMIVMVAACSSPPAAPAHHIHARPAVAAVSAQPDTPAGAEAAAQATFELYSAGQYAAVYQLLSPPVRAEVSAATWTAVHQACPPGASGLTYQVTDPQLVPGSSTAVVKVSLPGMGSSLLSETTTFDYVAGRWLWAPATTDENGYSGTAAQIVAYMKGKGLC
jgi:hypothetical protein